MREIFWWQHEDFVAFDIWWWKFFRFFWSMGNNHSQLFFFWINFLHLFFISFFLIILTLKVWKNHLALTELDKKFSIKHPLYLQIVFLCFCVLSTRCCLVEHPSRTQVRQTLRSLSCSASRKESLTSLAQSGGRSHTLPRSSSKVNKTIKKKKCFFLI